MLACSVSPSAFGFLGEGREARSEATAQASPTVRFEEGRLSAEALRGVGVFGCTEGPEGVLFAEALPLRGVCACGGIEVRGVPQHLSCNFSQHGYGDVNDDADDADDCFPWSERSACGLPLRGAPSFAPSATSVE